MKTHKDERFGTLYLIPEIGCQGCVANPKRTEPDQNICHSLPLCGTWSGWAPESAYIIWLTEVRMK
jgi:hypothetical protein